MNDKYKKIATEWCAEQPLHICAEISRRHKLLLDNDDTSNQEKAFRIWLLETQHTVEQAAELVREYGVALEYDNGDLELLDNVMSKALPDNVKPKGCFMYYYRFAGTPYWVASDKTTRPILKLSSVVEANQAIDLDGQEFYDLMQLYRIAPITNQEFVIERFEAVKNFIKKYCKK